jgi:redox-sensing transcriptional repressor
LFDTERSKIGRRSKGGVRIYEIGEFRKLVRRDQIDIAVVAVPADSAQGVVNTAVAAGIRAVLNFSPGTIKVPPGVKLKNVDLTVSLESLSFFLARGESDAQTA